MTLQRVEIPPLRLCRIPQCPNELDAKAPARGPKANMCEHCRNGEGLPIKFYKETLARGGELDAPLPAPARPREARYRSMKTGPTDVEIGVLRAVAAGMTNAQIGAATWRSEETIKQHIKNLLEKLEARNRAHLVSIGYLQGLLP